MGEGLKRAVDAAKKTQPITPMEARILNVLGAEFERPHVIARRAHIHSFSPSETASTYCRSLVLKGYAEKGGRPMFPMWRRKPGATP